MSSHVLLKESQQPPLKRRRPSVAKEPNLHPSEFLRALFDRAEFTPGLPETVFQNPTATELEAYTVEAVSAVRSGDLARCRKLYSAVSNDACRDSSDTFSSFQASNRFGETLLHMACRRGNVEIVEFLVREAKVRVNVRDDYGRTPLHDACWTTSPNFPVMDVLLDHVPPDMLLLSDIRGHTPFHYSRQEHWGEWVDYLRRKSQMLLRRASGVKNVGVQFSPR